MGYQGNSKQYIIVIWVNLFHQKARAEYFKMFPLTHTFWREKKKEGKKRLFLSGPINKKLSRKKMLRDDFSSSWQAHGAIANLYWLTEANFLHGATN